MLDTLKFKFIFQPASSTANIRERSRSGQRMLPEGVLRSWGAGRIQAKVRLALLALLVQSILTMDA